MQPKFLSKGNLKILFAIQCPKCETQNLFRAPLYALRPFLKMHRHCPSCQLDFVPEPGFYFGSAYFSYFINVGWFGLGSLFLWLAVPDAGVSTYIFFNSALMVVFLPYTFALSRSIWLNYIFHAHLRKQDAIQEADYTAEIQRLSAYNIDIQTHTPEFWKNFMHFIHHEKKCVYCDYQFEDFNTSGYKTCRNCLKDFTYKQFLHLSLEQFEVLEASQALIRKAD